MGIWKVLSMVFYLSNQFTNPIMFDIILKNFLFSMLWHKIQKCKPEQTEDNSYNLPMGQSKFSCGLMFWFISIENGGKQKS